MPSDDPRRALTERMQLLGARVAAAPPGERLAELARGGALGLALPAEVGGGGLDLVATALAYETLGAGVPDAGVLLAAGAHLFGVALTIRAAGTEAQKRLWLPRLASGET